MRVLVVEDEIIIAGNLCAFISDAGHEVAGLAVDQETAKALLQQGAADFAFIDIGLSDGMTGLDVARVAHEKGLPFTFMTGNFRLVLGDQLGAVGIIAKPYDYAMIERALGYLERAIADEPVGAPPAGLLLSRPWIERLGLSAAL